MKKIIPLLFVLLLINTLSAQRIDIDKYRFNVQSVHYPLYDIPLSERTFAVDFVGDDEFTDAADNISIKNFIYEEENPKFVVRLKARPFQKLKTELKKKVDKKKNKEGKIISQKTTYTVNYGNSGRAYASVFGDEYKSFQYKTPKQLKKEEEQKKKNEEKKRKEEATKKAKEKAKKDKKKAEMDANPFLQGVTSEVQEDDESLDGDVAQEDSKPLFGRNLNYTYSHSTKRYSTSSLAYKEANNNRDVSFENDRDSYREYIAKRASDQLNAAFNYRKKIEKASFRITDSKKHPENTKFIQAMEALKVILGKMRYNKPSDGIRKEVQPILDYMDSVAKRYSAKDKRGKKLRAAALFNMGKIYYYFEEAENLKAIADRLIKDGYRDGDGKDFLELVDLIQKRQEFFDPANRYPTIKKGEDDAELDDGTKVVDDETDGNK